MSRHVIELWGALALAAVMSLAACAAPVTEDSLGQESESTSSESSEETTITDGPIDPDQETKRTGPSVDFGGPDKGGQGLDVTDDGRWCETIALFWGGEAVPEGVTFTFEGITSSPPGLEMADDQSVCGTFGATAACVDVVLAHDANAFCSIALRATDEFQNGTSVGITGTLDCLTAEICDAVAARETSPGPDIVICDPVFVAEGNECARIDG